MLGGTRLLRRSAPRNDGREPAMPRKELNVESVAEAYLALLAERGVE
jgi:hypothetical protein